MAGATIIVGAQWGDEGKGLISAYLGMRDNPKYVARAGTGPNAEHGIFLRDEKTYLKTNQLPLGYMFNQDVEVRVGSGVAVDPVKMIAEIEKYKLHGRVKIDYRCPIVTQEHIEGEVNSSHNQAIGSTMSGTGLCRRDFIQRIAKQAKDFPELEEYLTDTAVDINTAAKTDNIIVESSQGTFLSLAVSPDYPNVTSDNVTAMAAADDVLLNWKYIKDVILIVKALPTREGAGGMGNVEEMSQKEMIEKGFLEPSSIGGTTRRKVYGIDWDMLQYAVEINGATQIALTFLDHYDPQMKNVISRDDITPKAWDLIAQISRKTQIPVTILNSGKAFDNIIDLTRDDPILWDKASLNLLRFNP